MKRCKDDLDMRNVRPIITKLIKDQIIKQSPTCGEIREILYGGEYSPNIVVALNVRPTTAHFHKGFDEIYFVLDGNLTVRTYDPQTGKRTEQKLAGNELCVISREIHHRITQASAQNRLCVITMPRFDARDEHLSDKI
jgi:mannose-6-phosphate isomerase-like protein (cupin superfamily)